MPKSNFLYAILVLLLALIFGSFQEKTKISINNILKYSQSVPGYNQLTAAERENKIAEKIALTPRDFYSHQSTIPWFYQLETTNLTKLKWINTFVFAAIHLAFNALILFFLFRDKKIVQLLIGAYTVFFIIAIGMYFIGKITGFAQPGYNVARKIVGALQSQIPVMLFTSGYYLNKKSNT